MDSCAWSLSEFFVNAVNWDMDHRYTCMYLKIFVQYKYFTLNVLFVADNANEYLPLIIFIILLVLILVLVGMAISFMREKHRKTAQLLSNMEGPLGTAPYQEEPINTDYSDDPNHVTTTVIKNDIYRDSINLEDTQVLGDVLPSNGEDGRIPIYNPRSKKNCKNRTDRKNTKRDEEVILRVHNINPTPLYSREHDRYW